MIAEVIRLVPAMASAQRIDVHQLSRGISSRYVRGGGVCVGGGDAVSIALDVSAYVCPYSVEYVIGGIDVAGERPRSENVQSAAAPPPRSVAALAHCVRGGIGSRRSEGFFANQKVCVCILAQGGNDTTSDA